jgi:hypothetical protein
VVTIVVEHLVGQAVLVGKDFVKLCKIIIQVTIFVFIKGVVIIGQKLDT